VKPHIRQFSNGTPATLTVNGLSADVAHDCPECIVGDSEAGRPFRGLLHASRPVFAAEFSGASKLWPSDRPLGKYSPVLARRFTRSFESSAIGDPVAGEREQREEQHLPGGDGRLRSTGHLFIDAATAG